MSITNSSPLSSSPYFQTQSDVSALYSEGAWSKYDGINTSSKNSSETKIPSLFEEEIRPVRICKLGNKISSVRLILDVPQPDELLS